MCHRPVSPRDLRGQDIWELYRVVVKFGGVSCSTLQVATTAVLPKTVKINLTDPVANWGAQLIPDLTEFQQRHFFQVI